MDVVLNNALYNEQEECLICMHNCFYVKQLVKREHFIHKISICFNPSWDLLQTAELSLDVARDHPPTLCFYCEKAEQQHFST